MNKLDLEETTRRFHYIYEQVAKEYGYKTREDTKELDFNSPNGMTMLKTVETITTPYLEEIERLREENLLLRASEPMSKLQEDYGYKAEVERLHSIIKEIREYIEKTDTFQIIHSVDSWGEKLRDKTKKDLLEILDKVDKEK